MQLSLYRSLMSASNRAFGCAILHSFSHFFRFESPCYRVSRVCVFLYIFSVFNTLWFFTCLSRSPLTLSFVPRSRSISAYRSGGLCFVLYFRFILFLCLFLFIYILYIYFALSFFPFSLSLSLSRLVSMLQFISYFHTISGPQHLLCHFLGRYLLHACFHLLTGIRTKICVRLYRYTFLFLFFIFLSFGPCVVFFSIYFTLFEFDSVCW